MFKKKHFCSLVIFLLILVLSLPLVGCEEEDDETVLHEIVDDSAVIAEKSANQDTNDTQIIIEATAKYLDAGKSPTISPQDVYKIITGRDTGYLLISLQKPEDYAKGHVKGAINIPYGQFYKKENLNKISRDKKIVTICYTGHTASQAAMLLNQLGYEAYSMKFGMMGWTSNPAPMGTVKFFAKPADYPVDTSPVEAEPKNDLPQLNTGKNSKEEIIISATENYLSAGKSPTVGPEDIFKAISAGDKTYFLVSLQKPEDYAKGHVKGAINIPFSQIAKETNLKKIPKDKKIVLICYTGHTASFSTMFLNQLGYDAYAMKFGQMGWSSNQAPMGTVKFYTKPADYEITSN